MKDSYQIVRSFGKDNISISIVEHLVGKEGTYIIPSVRATNMSCKKYTPTSSFEKKQGGHGFKDDNGNYYDCSEGSVIFKRPLIVMVTSDENFAEESNSYTLLIEMGLMKKHIYDYLYIEGIDKKLEEQFNSLLKENTVKKFLESSAVTVPTTLTNKQKKHLAQQLAKGKITPEQYNQALASQKGATPSKYNLPSSEGTASSNTSDPFANIRMLKEEYSKSQASLKAEIAKAIDSISKEEDAKLRAAIEQITDKYNEKKQMRIDDATIQLRKNYEAKKVAYEKAVAELKKLVETL